MQEALRAWFLKNRRPLPWRLSKSVYATVVSEFMCQQTQIDTVIPYFERWLKRFPDFKSLASAEEAEVLKLWEGLGYYRRARNLQSIAKALVERGAFPETAQKWKELPGIGDYTAAAIASICFNGKVAVVDGNVVRVCARLHALNQPFRNPGEAAKKVQPIADEFLNTRHPGEHNEAVMELGATVCRKSKPMCAFCPLEPFCMGKRLPELEQIPTWQRVKQKREQRSRAWVEQNGRLLLQRVKDPSSSLQGLFELPLADTLKDAKPMGTKYFAKENRAIGNRLISEKLFKFHWDERETRGADLIWVDRNELDAIALSGPHRKWIQKYWI